MDARRRSHSPGRPPTRSRGRAAGAALLVAPLLGGCGARAALHDVVLDHDEAVGRARLGPGERARRELSAGRRAWLHLARGAARVNGLELAAGDAAFTTQAGRLEVLAVEAAELLLFELA